MRFAKVAAAEAAAIRNRTARSKIDLTEYLAFLKTVNDGDLARIELDREADKKYTVTQRVKSAAFELSKEPTFYAGKPTELLFDLKPLTDERRAEILKAREDRLAELKAQRAEKAAPTASNGTDHADGKKPAAEAEKAAA